MVKRLGSILFNIPIYDYSFAVALIMVIIIASVHIPIIYFCKGNVPFLLGKIVKKNNI